MAASAKVSKQLDNNYVQIDITSKNMKPKYYKVPVKKADYFVNEYKKQSKNISIVTNTVFVGSILAGVLATSFFTKKLGTLSKFFLNSVGGVIGAAIGTYGTTKYTENQQNKLLKDTNAQEIYYLG